MSSDGSLEFIALDAIRRGDALCFSYGLKPNYELLTSYGFLLEDNPHDSLVIAGTVEELVSLFLRHANNGNSRSTSSNSIGSSSSSSSSSNKMWQERSKLQRVASRAVQEVMIARKQLEASEEWRDMQASGPQVHIGEQSPMAVFGSGAVDARALAGLTAMWHTVQRQRGERGTVAGLGRCIWVGWSGDPWFDQTYAHCV